MIPATKIARNNSEIVNPPVKATIGQLSLVNVKRLKMKAERNLY